VRSLWQDVCRFELISSSSTYSVSCLYLGSDCKLTSSTGKRPYECKVPECLRSFARRNTFLKHHRMTHPELPPPNAEASRPTVPLPMYTTQRLGSGPVMQPGPPDHEGRPQYWIPASSHITNTTAAPHAYAVSSPSGSTAVSQQDGTDLDDGERESESHDPTFIEGLDDKKTFAFGTRTRGGRTGTGRVRGGGRVRGRGRGGNRSRTRDVPPHLVNIGAEVKGEATDSQTNHVNVSPAETEQEASISTPLSSTFTELHEIGSTATQSIYPPDFESSISVNDGFRVGVGVESHSHSGLDSSIKQQQTFHSSIHSNPGHAHGYGIGLYTSAPLSIIPESGASHFNIRSQNTNVINNSNSINSHSDANHSQTVDPQSTNMSHTGSNVNTQLYVPNAFTDFSHQSPNPALDIANSGSHQIRHSNHHSLRATSNPEFTRPTVNTSNLDGGLGGGFSLGQVSMPDGGLQPSMYSTNDRSVSAPMTRDHSHSRSPDLVDVHAVPDFSIQAPTGPAIHVPYSAVDGYYTPLSHGPPRLNEPTQDVRLHSAPPHMQRFNSLPSVPTQSSISHSSFYNPTPLSAASSTFTDLPSPNPDLNQMEAKWVNLESHDQPTPGSTPIQQMNVVPTPRLWSQHIHYPTPPHPHLLARNPFSTPATNYSMSTPSLNGNSPMYASSPYMAQAGQVQLQQPAASMRLQHHYNGMQPQSQSQYPTYLQQPPQHLQPHHSQAIPQQSYFPAPSPITPSYNFTNFRMQSQPTSALASPVTFSGYHSASHNSPVDYSQRSVSDEYRHNVILTTPPRYTQEVNTVGLGISNVHFDDSRYIVSDQMLDQNMVDQNIDVKQELPTSHSNEENYTEGEPELDSDDDEYIQDDSDDEFLPGKKQIKRKRQTRKVSGKGGHKRSTSGVSIKM